VSAVARDTPSTPPAISSSTFAARAIAASSRARLRALLRRISSESAHGRARLLGIAAIACGTAALVFLLPLAGGAWIAQKGAHDVAQAAVAFALLGLTGALLLSCLGHAVSAFFTAKDLWFWESSAAPRVARFVDRVSETAITALPATATLGALALMGFFIGSQAGVLAVVRALVALALTALLPLSLGVTAAHVAGAVLPAGRLRRVSLVALGVLLTGALVVVRRARVEDIVTAEGAARLVESARSLSTIGPPLLPHNLGARFALHGDGVAFSLLLAWAATAIALAYGSHVLFFDRARDRAADESPTGLTRGSIAERALAVLVRAAPRGLRPLVEKDLLSFARDPAQWGQAILLLGVGVLYLVNATAMERGFSSMPHAKDIVMCGLHTGVASFIAAGLSVRFGFPAVGMEGPAVWILEAAPVAPRLLVSSKAFSSLPVIAFFPTTVALVGALVIGLPPTMLALSTLTVLVLSSSFTLYGVARGAERPAFDAHSVSELAMGPGALSAMFVTLTISFGTSLFAMAGAYALTRDDAAQKTLGVVFFTAPMLLTALLAVRARARGAAALARRRQDGTAGREGIGL